MRASARASARSQRLSSLEVHPNSLTTILSIAALVGRGLLSVIEGTQQMATKMKNESVNIRFALSVIVKMVRKSVMMESVASSTT